MGALARSPDVSQARVVRPDDTLVLKPRVQRADEVLRPTRADIDLSAIAHNFRVVQQAASGARVLAVVKADAYGHGVVPIVRALESEGAFAFGVALAEEGLELRDAGIKSAILVLNGVYGGAHREVLQRGLVPVVYDLGHLEAFSSVSGGSPFGVHLKIDTGMGRLGVPRGELSRFLERASRFANLRIDGLMTHFASADVDPDFTARQFACFNEAVAMVRAAGHTPTVQHVANSAATFRHPEARLDLVRPGIALFGYAGYDAPDLPSLRLGMRIRTEIVAVRTLAAGESVGYHGRFVAKGPTRVATLPVGYGDGLLRASSCRGHVLVRGKRCPILGNISMDLTSVDITGTNAEVGDEVVLLGAQGDAQIEVSELAEAANTIPYEVFTSVSRRVPRFYV